MFEGYLKAARSAILHSPYLEVKNVTHVPWSEQECLLFSEDAMVENEGDAGAPNQNSLPEEKLCQLQRSCKRKKGKSTQ